MASKLETRVKEMMTLPMDSITLERFEKAYAALGDTEFGLLRLKTELEHYFKDGVIRRNDSFWLYVTHGPRIANLMDLVTALRDETRSRSGQWKAKKPMIISLDRCVPPYLADGLFLAPVLTDIQQVTLREIHKMRPTAEEYQTVSECLTIPLEMVGGRKQGGFREKFTDKLHIILPLGVVC